jgi:DNA-binding response OmpR family regulator
VKKILVIDESPLVRKYLEGKLSEYGFEVILGVNGLDGSVKLRSDLPDLVIMDLVLSRKTSLELLKEKADNPNAAEIPVIMCSSAIDKNMLLEAAKYKVKKFFTKPLNIEALLSFISQILSVELGMDESPCIIEAHFNAEILFIEIARGLNRERVELLKYKIEELLDLYQQRVPKILIIMSDIRLDQEDVAKLEALFSNILKATGSPLRAIKVLTRSGLVINFLNANAGYRGIEVVENLSQAMDRLLGLKVKEAGDQTQQADGSALLLAARPAGGKRESFSLGMAADQAAHSGGGGGEDRKNLLIAAVDDDPVSRQLITTAFGATGFTVQGYENGRLFIDSLAENDFALIFLDLLMPVMDGFAVLEYLKEHEPQLPVIVLSALSQKETVIKAIGYGIKSYLTKPVKPEGILMKTIEILRTNF